jgi:glycerol-3-phosphate acyltransferase PlsY
MRIALLLAAGYLVGSIPFGVIVGQWLRGVDVRRYGSGNIGFSNVLRVLGAGPAALVLAGDMAKGALPVLAGRALLAAWGVAEPGLWLLGVALAPIVGHSFSVFLGFRGGRAVATTLGVLAGMSWAAAVVALVVWLGVVGATRYISVGSMAAAGCVPVYMALAGARWEWGGFWTLVAALVIARHIPNLGRLLAGRESKVGQRVEVEQQERRAR